MRSTKALVFQGSQYETKKLLKAAIVMKIYVLLFSLFVQFAWWGIFYLVLLGVAIICFSIAGILMLIIKHTADNSRYDAYNNLLCALFFILTIICAIVFIVKVGVVFCSYLSIVYSVYFLAVHCPIFI